MLRTAIVLLMRDFRIKWARSSIVCLILLGWVKYKKSIRPVEKVPLLKE